MTDTRIARSSTRWNSLRALTGATVLAWMFADSVVAAEDGGNTVRVCTLNWAPFVAADLPRQGFLNALTRQAFQASGRRMTMDFMPWARAKLEVRQGDRDMVQAAYYNEKRAKRYIFTDPLYPTKVGLITLESQGIETFDSLRDLEEYRIGLARGFTTSPEFDKADYLDKRPAKNNRLNVRKLYEGRIDMIAMNFDRFMYIANDEGYDTDRAVFLKPILAEHKLHLMASRAIPDGKEIVQDFNEGLEKLKDTGEYQQILEDMGYAR